MIEAAYSPVGWAPFHVPTRAWVKVGKKSAAHPAKWVRSHINIKLRDNGGQGSGVRVKLLEKRVPFGSGLTFDISLLFLIFTPPRATLFFLRFA